MATQITVPSTQEVTQSIDTAKVAELNPCQYWPEAKAFLQMLPTIVPNPFVKIAVPILIAVGDKLCPKA